MIDPEDLVQHPKLTGRFSEGSGYDATSQPRRWSLHYWTMDPSDLTLAKRMAILQRLSAHSARQEKLN